MTRNTISIVWKFASAIAFMIGGCNHGNASLCLVWDSADASSHAVFPQKLVGLWYTCGSGIEQSPSDGGNLPSIILIQSSGVVIVQDDYSRHGPDVFRSRGRVIGTRVEVRTVDGGWRPLYEVRDQQLATLGSHQPLCHARVLSDIPTDGYLLFQRHIPDVEE